MTTEPRDPDLERVARYLAQDLDVHVDRVREGLEFLVGLGLLEVRDPVEAALSPGAQARLQAYLSKWGRAP